MLQQTQVATVVDYYTRWMARRVVRCGQGRGQVWSGEQVSHTWCSGCSGAQVADPGQPGGGHGGGGAGDVVRARLLLQVLGLTNLSMPEGKC